MKFGTIFYEKVTDSENWRTHYEHLLEIGIQHLELTCHSLLFPESIYKALSAQARQDQIQLSFHMPDFCQPELFDIGGFQKTLLQRTHWESYFKRLSSLQAGSNPSLMIAHGGSEFMSKNFQQAPRDATLRFFDWALRHIEKFHPELQLAIENTCILDGPAYAQTETDLEEMLANFNDAHSFGWCLDLAHYVRNQLAQQKKLNQYSSEVKFDLSNVKFDFIDINLFTVKEIHLHGFSNDLLLSHVPLSHLNTSLTRWMRLHQKELSSVPVVFEFLTGSSIEDEPKLLQLLVNTLNEI